MALQARPDKEERLRTWKDVRNYAKAKDESVRWCPCTLGMRVYGDEFIKTGDGERLHVSERGWAALCRSLACDPGTVRGIGSWGLATQVLNDAWARNAEGMMNRRIVIDGRTVVGVVGSRYQPYKHGQLVEVIDELLGGQDNGHWANVGSAWDQIGENGGIARTIGTELRITLPLRRHTHSTRVEGAGGKGTDISWIGVEARNGLSGECSVGIRTLVHRLVCANGMVRPAADNKRRISHTGGQSELDEKVRRILGTATDDLGNTVSWLKALGDRVFSARDLARDRESVKLVRQMLVDLKGGSRWRRQLVQRQNGDHLPTVLNRMVETMAGPLSGEVWRAQYRSNATWWDFVNIFTEASQNCGSLKKQSRVEERAGRLAERWAKDEREPRSSRADRSGRASSGGAEGRASGRPDGQGTRYVPRRLS